MILHTLNFVIDWEEFKPYTSFFIPCLDYKKAKKLIKAECDKRGYVVRIYVRIEDGILGVRAWRREVKQVDLS
jgi:hypothetical protein